MRVSKFYLFPIIYLVAVYSVFFAPEWLDYFVPEDEVMLYILGFVLCVGIINIVVCKKYCNPENERVLLISAILVKYALIPFYIMGCILITFFALMTFIPIPITIFMGPSGVILLSVIGWIVLALSSPYSIAYLHSSRKAGKRHVAVVWIHTILQFFFGLDVLDIMFLSIKENVWRKLSIGLLVLIVLAVLAVGIAFVFGIVKMIIG